MFHIADQVFSADYETLTDDWQKVGDDIQNALGRYKKENANW
jgi:hypothetical protein